MESLFNKVNQTYNTRCVKPSAQPSFNTITYGCNSFIYQGVKEGNVLNSVFKAQRSVEDFKGIDTDVEWQAV